MLFLISVLSSCSENGDKVLYEDDSDLMDDEEMNEKCFEFCCETAGIKLNCFTLVKFPGDIYYYINKVLLPLVMKTKKLKYFFEKKYKKQQRVYISNCSQHFRCQQKKIWWYYQNQKKKLNQTPRKLSEI